MPAVPPAPVPPAEGGGRLAVLAVTLTVGTGALDVAGFARLGGVFSSVMTGNLVVCGFAIGTAAFAQLLTGVTAIGGYVAGVLGGTRITSRFRSRRDAAAEAGWRCPRGVIAALAAELAVLAVFAAGWVAAGPRPAAVPLHGLLALAAVAMGLQSAAMRGLGGGHPVSTTYLTGTLTGVVAALITVGRPQGARLRDLTVLTAVPVGAAGGALVLAYAPALLPAIPLATVLTAVTVATLLH
ncbi:YoaK family protein [Nonomuraea bangladeshensis]|uniref:YoaK family protein n=1 Tax=Nonomuraea bangladeshensis TaxID=404385 RepID=UPI003C2DAA44